MMGSHIRSESLFYYFRLEDQVPENHLLRLIDHVFQKPAWTIPAVEFVGSAELFTCTVKNEPAFSKGLLVRSNCRRNRSRRKCKACQGLLGQQLGTITQAEVSCTNSGHERLLFKE